MAEPETAASPRYVVVARRYRPRGFDQLVGQEHVAKALVNAIETGRVGHAYLFTGARGVGKTSTARIFAKALNCPEGPSLNPDDSSDICQAIDAGEDIDVLEIDGASNRGIDEIRQLRAGVGVRPSRARYKIYIIDEVHMLTAPAFNALLKTLEEPPEHVKFIFCTTDPEKIPITVLSRCQRFDFAPVRMEAIADRLREIVDSEKAEADQEALKLLARRAAGSMRDSQSLLEQVMSFSSGPITVASVHEMLGTADDSRLHELGNALCERDSRSALEQIDKAIAGGVDAGQLAEQLLGYFRDMMTATVGCSQELLRYCGPGLFEELQTRGAKAGLQTILAIVGLLDQTLVRIRQSVHGQILLEAAVVQICALPDLEAISQLANGLAATRTDGGNRSRGAAPHAAKEHPAEKKKPTTAGSPLKSQASSGTPGVVDAREVDAREPQARKPVVPHSIGKEDAPLVASPDRSKPQEPNAAAPRETDSDREKANAGPTGSGDSDKQRAEAETSTNLDASSQVASGVQNDRQDRIIQPVLEATARWDEAGATKVWQAALAALDDLTADFARQAVSAVPVGNNRLRLIFTADKELAKRSCEKPERKSKLEAVLRAVSARDVLIECQLRADEQHDPVPPRPSTAVNRRQRMRDAEQNPRVRNVIEMFDAEIVRVDEPRDS